MDRSSEKARILVNDCIRFCNFGLVYRNRQTIGVDLTLTTLLGWFVLASLTVNEARSIIENFVEAGYDVPKILIKGLEVADKKINQEEI